MNLVKIDGLDTQAAQAVFDLAADRFGFQNFLYLTFRIPAQAAFGKDIRPRSRPTLERPRYDVFRVSEAVDRRSINPVDAEFECPVNRRDRIVVVLRSPCKLPARAANGPGSVTDRSNIQI